MNADQQLAELEQLAETLSVRVCYESMTGVIQGAGGLCRVKGEFRVIMDRRLRTSERVDVLVDALRRFELDQHFISPLVRQLLDPGALGALPS